MTNTPLSQPLPTGSLLKVATPDAFVAPSALLLIALFPHRSSPLLQPVSHMSLAGMPVIGVPLASRTVSVIWQLVPPAAFVNGSPSPCGQISTTPGV
jgi:hypothetical protein